MARVLQSVVNQYGKGTTEQIPERCIVQYFDDVTGEEGYNIIEVADMTAPQKAIFDNYKNLADQLMID